MPHLASFAVMAFSRDDLARGLAVTVREGDRLHLSRLTRRRAHFHGSFPCGWPRLGECRSECRRGAACAPELQSGDGWELRSGGRYDSRPDGQAYTPMSGTDGGRGACRTGRGAISRQNLVARQTKAYGRLVGLVEPVRRHGFADVGTEIFPRIRLREDVLAQSLGGIPAIGLLRHVKNDFAFHGFQYTTCPVSGQGAIACCLPANANVNVNRVVHRCRGLAQMEFKVKAHGGAERTEEILFFRRDANAAQLATPKSENSQETGQ